MQRSSHDVGRYGKRSRLARILRIAILEILALPTRRPLADLIDAVTRGLKVREAEPGLRLGSWRSGRRSQAAARPPAPQGSAFADALNYDERIPDDEEAVGTEPRIATHWSDRSDPLEAATLAGIGT